MLKNICQRHWQNIRTMVIMTSAIVCTCHPVEALYKSVMSDAARTEKCWRNPLEPAASFTSDAVCDPLSNCRYGGICWSSRSDIILSRRHEKSKDNSSEAICRCTMHCQSFAGRSRTNPALNLVCGSDGRTYSNECELRLASCRCQYPITMRKRGRCETESPPLVTAQIQLHGALSEEGSGSGSDVNLHCGSGITCQFGAVCDVDSEDGPCLCIMVCSDRSAYTVCGTDGRSYYNECYLREAACQEQIEIEIDHVGACKAAKGSNQVVEPEQGSGDDLDISICNALNCAGDMINPLCGSDGENYPTLCSMRVAACQQQRVITMLHRGYCVEADSRNNETVIGSSETSGTKPNDPCENIFCLQGVCVPSGSDDFECSCEALCSQDAVSKQTSISKLGGITLRQLYAFVPEIKSQLFSEDLEQYSLETTTTTPRTTTTTIPADEMELPEPVIDSLDGVKELSALRIKPGMSRQQLYRNTNFDIIGDFEYSDVHWRRHRRRRRRQRRGRRHRRRVRRSAVFDLTSSYVNQTVCGTDGKTYKDECQMRVNACYEKKVVKIRKIGACPYQFKKKQGHAKGNKKNWKVTTDDTLHVEISAKTVIFPITNNIKIVETATTTVKDVSISSPNFVEMTTGAGFRGATDATTKRNAPNIKNINRTIMAAANGQEINKNLPLTVVQSDRVSSKNGMNNSVELTLAEVFDQEFVKQPKVSEAHIVEYSWLIVLAGILHVVLTALLFGVCYKRWKLKRKSISDEETKSAVSETATVD